MEIIKNKNNADFFSGKIADKERQKPKTVRNKNKSVWFGSGMMKMVGWAVLVPSLLGAGLGIWLDKSYPESFSWTLSCLVIGLFTGSIIAWYWVAKEGKKMHDNEGNNITKMGITKNIADRFVSNKIKTNAMTIQINTDKNLDVHETYQAELEDLLSAEVSRFNEYITRLEVHLSDENGNKESQDDKRCMIEARLKGRQPIAVTNVGNTYDLAVSGAIDKLTTSLDTILGKMKNH